MVHYDLTPWGNEAMEEVFYGDTFEPVTEETIFAHGRWHVSKERVFKEVATGKYWLAEWREGATEMQDTDPDLTLVLVEPIQETVTNYKIVKD